MKVISASLACFVNEDTMVPHKQQQKQIQMCSVCTVQKLTLYTLNIKVVWLNHHSSLIDVEVI